MNLHEYQAKSIIEKIWYASTGRYLGKQMQMAVARI